MTEDQHHYRLLRLTLEAVSAHAIHSGKGDMTHDVLLVRDANGLPTLPGTSLAGVLRHQFRAQYGAEAESRVFGVAGGRGEDSWVSRLQVGWGMVHDSRNQPVEGLQADSTLLEDALLQQLADAKPLVRQRVRLNARGSAAAEGKFDTTLIPAGVRYTCLLGYWSDGHEETEQDWQDLLQLLQQPQLRLGHGVRAGAGQFKPVALYLGQWDLTRPEQAEAYRQRPRRRTETAGLEEQPLAGSAAEPFIKLELQAEGGWRVGGGEELLPGSEGDAANPPDLLPMHEYRIQWAQDRGQASQPCHLLPATAIKGALRHRVAYHYRCLTGAFADPQGSELPEAGDCEAVRQLFGFAEQGRAAEAGQQARAGVLAIEDIHIDQGQTLVMMHNRIDRFTGGVIKGALFDEQVLWDTPITLRIHLTDEKAAEQVDAKARQALQRTLEDLAHGWLPLGAAGSRGLGVFTAPDNQGPQWRDGGQWLRAEPTTQQEDRA